VTYFIHSYIIFQGFNLHTPKHTNYIPPYRSSMLTIWSPFFSKNVMAVVVPRPEEKTMPEIENEQLIKTT